MDNSKQKDIQHVPGNEAQTDAQETEAEIVQRKVRQEGRLEVAEQVKYLLRGPLASLMAPQVRPGTRPPTAEEIRVLEYVSNISERLGATLGENIENK